MSVQGSAAGRTDPVLPPLLHCQLVLSPVYKSKLSCKEINTADPGKVLRGPVQGQGCAESGGCYSMCRVMGSFGLQPVCMTTAGSRLLRQVALAKRHIRRRASQFTTAAGCSKMQQQKSKHVVRLVS